MIYNTNPEYNPDYPQSNGMGFEQYCYQQASAPAMEYYYAGGNMAFPTAPNSPDPFSRRNQPVVPQAIPQAPFVQPQAIPQAPATGWGFNQMAESRRNMGPAPVPQTLSFNMAAPTQPQYPVNPWNSLPQFDGWSMQQPMAYAPPVPQFDQSCMNAAQQHHGLFYEQPQYVSAPPPEINWGSQQPMNLDAAKYQPVQFPFQPQAIQTNWLEQVKRNFAGQ